MSLYNLLFSTDTAQRSTGKFLSDHRKVELRLTSSFRSFIKYIKAILPPKKAQYKASYGKVTSLRVLISKGWNMTEKEEQAGNCSKSSCSLSPKRIWFHLVLFLKHEICYQIVTACSSMFEENCHFKKIIQSVSNLAALVHDDAFGFGAWRLQEIAREFRSWLSGSVSHSLAVRLPGEAVFENQPLFM